MRATDLRATNNEVNAEENQLWLHFLDKRGRNSRVVLGTVVESKMKENHEIPDWHGGLGKVK